MKSIFGVGLEILAVIKWIECCQKTYILGCKLMIYKGKNVE